MSSIYDYAEFNLHLLEVKNYFLDLTVNDIYSIYKKICFSELEWFYGKHICYLDYINHDNEINGIKYKIFKKKFKSITEALEKGIDCSGIKDGKQIVFFAGSLVDKHSKFIPCTLLMGDFYVGFEVSRNLDCINRKISVKKYFSIRDNVRLTIGISGEWGERSSMQLDYYENGSRVKTVISINDDKYFNPYRHKIDSEYFFEFSQDSLKRIYIIGKNNEDINIYLKTN